jgi:hypothetical protein
MGYLIDVHMENGEDTLAKIVDETESTYKVRYLNLVKDGTLYRYTKEIFEIEKECVSGFYDDDDTEEAAGFVRVDGGYAPIDDVEDEDYEPSEMEDSDNESDCDDYDTEDEDEEYCEN